MSLYRAKSLFVATLAPFERVAIRRQVSPNTLTAHGLALGIAAAAAVAIGSVWPMVWIAVLPLNVARLALNALDGSVARITGVETDRGAVANELSDRLADVLLMCAAFVVAPWWVAAAALASVQFAEYVPVLGWAVHGIRRFDGPMGKPDRALLVSVGCLVGVWLPAAAAVSYGVVGLGSLVTAWMRTRGLLREISR